MEFKNEQAVIIIQKVFLQPKTMIIEWTNFEEVIKRFFGRVHTRKIPANYYSTWKDTF